MKDKKNYLLLVVSFLLAIVLLASFLIPKKVISVNALVPNETTQLQITAKSMCVIEQNSKRLLLEKDKDIRLPMASTTKIMTAIVALENCDNLDEKFLTDNRAVGVEGTSIYLRKDESLSMRELLYGLMLNSGNDAAMAIAYKIGNGNVEKFVDLMNQKVVELKLENTHFDNPHGLDSVTHFTSSYDLAVITSYAMQNEDFNQIVKTEIKEITAPKEMGHRFVRNKHKLLKSMQGCDGVKTGFTDNARRCCVTSCVRDGMRLICVVLNCNDMFNESQKCLENCFETYKLYKVVPAYQYIGSSLVNNGSKENVELYVKHEVSFPIKEGEIDFFKTEINFDEVIDAPFKKDQEVGEIKVFFENELIYSQKIYTIESVDEKSLKDKVKDIFDQWYLD